MNIKMLQELNNVLKMLVFISFASFLFFASRCSRKETEQKVNEIRSEYSVIGTTKKNYNGVIKNYSIGNIYMKGMEIYIDLSNGEKIVIPGNTYNSQYRKKDLRDNLKVNDSIYYNYKTDEFYIYRKGHTFYFKLWHEI